MKPSFGNARYLLWGILLSIVPFIISCSVAQYHQGAPPTPEQSRTERFSGYEECGARKIVDERFDEERCITPYAKPDRLYAKGRWIYDDNGRVFFLRGFNYSHRSKFPDPDDWPEMRNQSPFEWDWSSWMKRHHFKQMAEWGANTVRLQVMWEAVEPKPDEYNEKYIRNIAQAVDWAKQFDIKVILDFHQNLWSRRFGGSMAPDWATIKKPDPDEADYSYDPFWGQRYFTWDSVQANFDRFWESDDLQNHYAQAWVQVVKAVKDRDNVIGYDLMNEPHPGSGSFNPWFESNELLPFYLRVIDRIREVDKERTICLNPWINVSGNLPSYFPDVPRENVMYCPHTYDTLALGGGVYLGKWWENYAIYPLIMDKGKELNIPVVMGEWGIIRTLDFSDQYIEDHAQLHESYMISGSIHWNFNPEAPVEDHPENPVPSFPRHVEPDMFSVIKKNGDTVSFLDSLDRPYPRVVAGTPVDFGWNPESGVFHLTYRHREGVKGPTKVYIPKDRHYPDGFRVKSNDPALEHDFDPEAEILTLRGSKKVEQRTVRVIPSR